MRLVLCVYVCAYVSQQLHSLYPHEENTRLFTAICFQRIWWISKFGGLTRYSLVLVHFIGTGKLWQIKRFGG